MAAPASAARKVDVAVGVLTVVVAAVFWLQRNYRTQYGGTFADPVIIALAVLGVTLVALGLLRRSARSGAEAEAQERMSPRSLVLAVALLVGWVAALPYLGYLVGGIVFFVLVAVLMRTERPTPRGILLDVVVAVAVVTAFYLIFTEVLYVRLPQLAF